MVPSWLKSLFPRRPIRTKPNSRTRPTARPNLVLLEDRAVPANVSIADIAIAEGDAGTQMLMFTVTADAMEAADITFKFNTANVTATAGSDYVAVVDGTGTIAAGDTTTKISVTINGDEPVELDETFTVTLSDLSAGNAFTDDTATGTIVNDDQAIISISGPSVAEGGLLAYSVTIDNAVDVPVTADRKTQDGTAIAGSDYTALAVGNVQLFAANSKAAFAINVATKADTTVEADETLSLILSTLAASGRNVVFTGGGMTLSGTGTITNDDKTTLTINNQTVGEGDGSVTFTITSSNAVQGGFKVDYQTADGTAKAGKDYVAETGTETFTGTAGEQETFTIAITNDNIVEADETFILSLLNVVAGVGVSTAAFDITDTGTGTIDSGDQAEFRITANAAATEGSPVTFTITLTNQVDATTSVTLTTAGGSATAGTDYTDLTGTVVQFAPLVTSVMVMVATTADNVVEANETFTFSIGTVNDGGIAGDVTIDGAQDSRTGTINNDDEAKFSITKMASAVEGSPVMFTVSLSNPVDVATSVKVTTTDGSAKSPQDFSKLSDFVVTFDPGDVSKIVSVTTKLDADVEVDETFAIALGGLVDGGRKVTIDAANGTGTGTIIDDDSAVLTIDDVTQDENAGTMTFTVTLAGAVAGGFDVNFTTVDGTAKVGNADYISNSSSLTFLGTDGETKTIVVSINADSTVELDETFTVDLSDPVNGMGKSVNVATADSGLGTIVNDDAALISIAKTASAAEGSKVGFTVTLSNPVDVTTSVTVTTADVSALAGTDYTALVGTTVTFVAGDQSETAQVSTTADNTVEPDETFTIALGGLNDGGRKVTIDAANASGEGTIVNDDSAEFSIANASAAEGGTITFTITLSNPVSTDTSVTVTTADLTAVDGVDYTGIAGVTVMFPAGTVSKQVTVDTTADTVVEADEKFTAALGALNDGGFPGKVTISVANGSATGTIANDDSTALTVLDVSQAEAAGKMKFTVTLSQAVQGGFAVDFKANNGTATTGDNDFGGSGTLVFAGTAGETQSFEVTINDDNKVEADETFTVSLFNVVPAAGVSAAKIDATDTALGTIVNDDAAQFKITETGTAVEGNKVQFTVSLTNPVDVATSVTVTTTDGTAKSVGAPAFDNDFVALAAQTVNFAANVTSVDVFVTTNADNIVELDESFAIAIGGLNDGGRTVTIDAANDTGAGTITNDDAAQFKITAASSAAEGGPIAFTVSLTNPVDVATSVTVTTADVTAEAGKDYTAILGKVVNFAALETSQVVMVTTLDDDVVEANETFSIALGGLVDGGRDVTISPADKTGVGTITNNDAASLSIADVAQNEATGAITFMVLLTGDVQGGFSVDIQTNDGTATAANVDFVASLKTLVFAGTSGESKTFTVTVNDDNTVEADETFTVNLLNVSPNDAKVKASDIGSSDTATGTIANDDTTKLTVADVSQAEGAGPMTFTVTLSNPVQGGLKVDFATADGTALIGDDDYETATGTLTFAGTAGETQTFLVTINSDATIEPDETFTVSLSNVATLGAGVSAANVDATDTATGTILSDDKAVIDLFASVDAEGNNLVYTVKLSNPISKDLSVDFATLAGIGLRPAVSGVDFTAVAKTVTFAAGTTMQTVLVPLFNDRRVEGSEQFDSKISNIVADATVIGALSIGQAQDTATIADNDAAEFSFTQAAGASSENNVPNVTATVQLLVNANGTGPDGIDRPVVIRVAGSGGTATVGVDFKNFTDPTDLTFAPGNFTTIAQNIAFDLVEDLNKEGDETILFDLAILNDFTAGQAKLGATKTHTFAIQSDDETVRTYDASAAGDYLFVRNGANVELYFVAGMTKTLLSSDAVGAQALVLNGTAGTDSATVDFSAGSPTPTNGLNFNAGGPTAGEKLVIANGDFTKIANTFSNTFSDQFGGTIVLQGAAPGTVNFAGVASAELNVASVVDLVLTLPNTGSANQAVLEDDGAAGNGASRIRSANATFATTKFANPSGTLSVAPAAPLADTLTINAMPDNGSSLTAGSNANRFLTVAQNGAVGSNGDVRYFGGNIVIGDGANLTAAGSVEFNANATVTLGNATIAGNVFAQSGTGSVVIGAGDTATVVANGAAGNTIAFNGAIDGPGSLTTVSTGTTVFGQPLGANVPLGAVAFQAPIVANGATPVTGGKTGGALNVAAGSIAINAAISAPNAPIVFTLAGGLASQTAPFVTTKLYLNGNGTFDLSNAANQLTSVPAGQIAKFITVDGFKTKVDVAGIQNLPGELFANLDGGSFVVRDATDVVIRFENASQNPAIRVGGNGIATILAGGDVSIEDPLVGPNVPANTIKALMDVGIGFVNVGVGVDRNDPGQKTIVRYFAEATATKVILGLPPSPTQPFADRVGIGELENVAQDTFTVRPMLGSQLVVNGNSPIALDGKNFRPFDTLVPQFAGIGSTNLTPQGNGDGIFSFGGTGFQPLSFTSIETLGGFQSEAFVVQTGPRVDDPTNEYAVRLKLSLSVAGAGGATEINTKLVGSGIITNPFVVTPVSSSAQTVFAPPKVTFGEFDGDNVPDLVLVNGAGDAPLVTIVKGSRLTQPQLDAQGNQITDAQGNPLVVPLDLSKLVQSDIVSQFVAFEETFRGGLNVATGDFDNDGRAEIAIAAGVGGGPRITVFKIDTNPLRSVFANADVYGANAGNPYNFFPYEESFRGGVNVAIGDVDGDRVPDIIAGAGFGGGPRVRVFKGSSTPTVAERSVLLEGGRLVPVPAPTIADFFAYDPNFRGGVFVDAGRFDSDDVSDLLTAPGPGGSAHIQVFQGQKGAQPFGAPSFNAIGAEFRTPSLSFIAFAAEPPSLLNPNTGRSGVGGAVFGASTDGLGAQRAILVTLPEGLSFQVVKFEQVDPATVLTPAEIAAGVTLRTEAPLGIVLKQTPNFQNAISDDLNGVILDDNSFKPFSLLRDGGSAGGFS